MYIHISGSEKKSPVINLCIHVQLIFDKSSKAMQWGKKITLFQQMIFWQLDSHMQKNEVGALSHSIYKINSKWIKELNSRAKAIELLEENTEVNIF